MGCLGCLCLQYQQTKSHANLRVTKTKIKPFIETSFEVLIPTKCLVRLRTIYMTVLNFLLS